VVPAGALHVAVQAAAGPLELRVLRGADEHRVTVTLDGTPFPQPGAARGLHAV
jgi:hypothetical protein